MPAPNLPRFKFINNRLTLSATELNKLPDAIRGIWRRLDSLGTQNGIRTVAVKNNTGAALPSLFSIVGLGDNVRDPDTGDLSSWYEQTVMEGDTPDHSQTAYPYWRNFAIVPNALQENETGIAIVSGILPVKLLVDDVVHEYANVRHNTLKNMISGSAGVAKIMWKSSTTDIDGNVWALVSIMEPHDHLVLGKNDSDALDTMPAGSFGLIDSFVSGVRFDVKKPDSDSISAPKLIISTATVGYGDYGVFVNPMRGDLHVKPGGTSPDEGEAFGSVSGQWYGNAGKTGFLALGVGKGGYAHASPFSSASSLNTWLIGSFSTTINQTATGGPGAYSEVAYTSAFTVPSTPSFAALSHIMFYDAGSGTPDDIIQAFVQVTSGTANLGYMKLFAVFYDSGGTPIGETSIVEVNFATAISGSANGLIYATQAKAGEIDVPSQPATMKFGLQWVGTLGTASATFGGYIDEGTPGTTEQVGALLIGGL